MVQTSQGQGTVADLFDSSFAQELQGMFKAYFYLSMELVRDVVKALEEVCEHGYERVCVVLGHFT